VMLHKQKYQEKSTVEMYHLIISRSALEIDNVEYVFCHNGLGSKIISLLI